jgi:hypothetical protein
MLAMYSLVEMIAKHEELSPVLFFCAPGCFKLHCKHLMDRFRVRRCKISSSTMDLFRIVA